MTKKDITFIFCIVLFFSSFFISKNYFNFYESFNKAHGMIMSFIKFAILATLGEVIGLRIKTGKYYKKGFGILPRAIVWGFLGLTIKMSFVIFAKGTPAFLEYMGINGAENAINDKITALSVLVAFSTSTALNLTFAPVMMTFHKIMNTHILNNGGTLKGFFTPVRFSNIIINLNWDVQWNFIIKKTIPFFWIPAHTITFLLPVEWRVLFAALLGIVLGVILAIANLKKNKLSIR